MFDIFDHIGHQVNNLLSYSLDFIDFCIDPFKPLWYILAVEGTVL